MDQFSNQRSTPERLPKSLGAPSEGNSAPTYRYTDLSPSGNEVLIEYEGQIYRLRKTRNGKLILNK